jgi:hypothetical protein
MGRSLERVLFVFGDELDIVAAAEVLWSEEEPRVELARSVLNHALQREPTRAQAEAFVARFKAELDDVEGRGWTISYRELQRWLQELGVRGQRSNR